MPSQAEQLRRYMNGLEACLAQAGQVEPAGGICSIQSLAQLQAELEKTGAAYQQEKVASQGVSTMVLFGEGEPSTIPQVPSPVRTRQIDGWWYVTGVVAGNRSHFHRGAQKNQEVGCFNDCSAGLKQSSGRR